MTPRTATPRTATPRRRSRSHRPAVGIMVSVVLVVAFISVFLIVDARWAVPGWVAMLYLVVSLVAFVSYAVDKSAAVAGRWRISENTLLGLGLVGGWPGALLAQQVLRHKIRKRSFMVPFVVTVIVNVGAFVLLLSPLGPALFDLVTGAGR
ncbi:MAG: DUF1294 domain-containing protein [Mycetocola sp.]